MSSKLGVWWGLTTSQGKKPIIMKFHTGTQMWACSCEYGNVPSGSVKGGEFLDWLTYS